MEKEVKCPWCGEIAAPELRIFHGDYGEVKERRCPKCNSILAAYLNKERPGLERVRTFNDCS
ncbi:MAG: hypothetical protein HY530_07185 [Chloroflexi bacterium]|nr:hypothetical protein [Chloroflexota bacterium]